MINNEEMEPLNIIRPEQERKKWDVFEDPPIAIATGSAVETKWIDFGEKFGKAFCYIFGFIMVLGGAMVSKGCLLFMTSQLSGKTKQYCRKYLDAHKQFRITLPLEEKAVWMWMILFVFFVPQLGTFIRSVRMLLYKDWKKPTSAQFVAIFISESCSTIGNAMLVYAVLPNLDVVKGVMLTNAFSFVPAILIVASKLYQIYQEKFLQRYDRIHDTVDADLSPKLTVDVLCILAQSTVFFVWPLVEERVVLWCIPITALFISSAWWENYTFDSNKLKKKESIYEIDSFARQLLKTNRKFSNSRYFTYMFISVWKCILFFMMMVFIEWAQHGDVGHVLDMARIFKSNNITIQEVKPIVPNQSSLQDAISLGSSVVIKSNNLIPVWVFLICICSTYLCYIFGKFCCKVYVQGFSYAFPVNLAVPVTISGLIAMCGVYNKDECAFADTIPSYLFFDSPPMHYLSDFVGQQHSWIWLLWLLSQMWITQHIWSPKSERLAKTERLFVRPMYEPFVIDQDLGMNRRILDEPLKESNRQEELDRRQAILNWELNRNLSKMVPVNDEDSVCRIYACGTMWHETKEEMMEFLKSIFRLDEDQCARRIIKSYLEYPVSDYYELETHIFFDDAFVRLSQDDHDPQLNTYVKDLINAVDDAASKVHETNIRVRPPVRSITPYGGRLVWVLPGKTKLIAHLKDKKKIRAKKRWSQVMYMYYLLGHRLMERDDWDEHKKTLRSNNTYILALDGDIDFQPKAVHLLVDLMKKDMNVGAACGRIHPMGSGPMVWYQMFEYAIGHWMQKATEHVIGCVLCSPGCFSLFRGSALMDANVMRRYATKSSDALHYVQFDQGEDRWLCTLLLQRGYRVEYSAASDAYTHCPEGFNEFFNQRRRWMPSTTANIFDLLLNSERTIKINNNISRLYILYQLFLMIGTILGPGTIFLMLVGAFVAAFQLDQWSSFLWNVVPIMFFVIVCLIFTKDTIQLFVAGILGGIYSLIMMAVLVGILLQINNDGLLAPSSLFFFCVAGQIIIAALLHPKEFNCLKYGVVYYITVPCMYMILVIYSVFNMNNVSWGTREVTVVPQAKPERELLNTEPEKNDKKQSKLSQILRLKDDDRKGELEFSLGRIFKCLCFTSPDRAGNDQLKAIMEKLEHVENQKLLEIKEETYDKPPSIQSFDTFDDAPVNSWMEDESLQRGYVEIPSHKEIEFWHGILEKYLYPIDDTDNKERIAANLKALRNKMVLAFFMLNALFVLTIFLLTLKKEYINIKWPLQVRYNFTYLGDINEIRIYAQHLQLEPIGVVFLAAFASLLLIQFTAMLIHRLKTFSQIVANTNLSLYDKSVDNLTEEQVVEMNPVVYIKKLQKLKGADDSDDEDDTLMNMIPSRRPTVFRLQRRAQKQQYGTNDLEEAFTRRLELGANYKGPLPRKTVEVIAQRRKTVVENRKPAYGQENSTTLAQGQINRGFINDDTFASFA